jgi:CHAT domain-containing protein
MERVHDLLQLAQVEIGLQRGSDALATLDRAQPLVMGNASGSEAALYSIRARALLEQGAIEAARSQARRALAVASTSWVGEDAGTRLGQQIAAGRALEVMLESAKGSGESESRDVARETFELLQQVQAHGLLEYVQGGQRSIEPDVPDSLLEQERAARVAVDHLQQELGSGPNSAASRDSLRLALAEAQARQERLRTLIFRLDQRYREMTQPAEVDSSQLDRLLAPGTLILDYLCGRGCQPGDSCPLLLFAADSSGVNAYTLGQTTDIARQVALLSDLLAHPPARGKDEDVQLLLSDLGHVLLGPVAERIDRYDSVIVVPDGVLTRVPFAALRVPIAGNPSHEVYVLEKTTIQTVPSLAVLSQLRRAQLHEHAARPRWDIAIWSGSGSATEAGGTRSNPSLKLPHAEDELRVLRSGFARTTVLQVNSKELRASHGELSSLVPVGSSKVLHFIAHGYFDRRQPWRSGLYFTGGPNGQSLQKLEIADIYRMKLQCSLVTLSACETARGSFDEGVGFLGLTQALFGSGVPSVLATLWPIDDASAPKFISAFYRQLVTGSTKAEALRQAQLQFLQDEKFRQPFYWAPYVLMGDGAGTVKLTLRRSVSLATPGVTLAIGLLLLLAALWSWRRRVGH